MQRKAWQTLPFVTLLVAAGLLTSGCEDSPTGTAPQEPSPSAVAAKGPPGGAPGGQDGSSDCTVAVSPSPTGSSLQDAIDQASDGDVICAEPGSFDPVVVDAADLTLRSTEAHAATIEGSGGTSAAISIEAHGVAVEGLTVTNPGGLLGIKVERGYDGVTVENNVVEDVGPTGRLGVTGIIVGQGGHEDIEVTNNLIQNLDQETTSRSNFPTVNGILFDADNSDPGLITNVAVNNNTIRNVESDIAPLGIVVQHETDGVSLNRNRISGLTAADDTDSDPSDGVDFDFTFAQGINIASPSTANTTVNRNVIRDIASAEAILPEAVKIDGDGGGVTFRANRFEVAIGLNNRNGERTNQGDPRDPSGDPVVDAKNNYWGSPQGPEEADFNQDGDDDAQADVVGNVVAEPFLRNPPGGPGNGSGGPPATTPGNGTPGN